MSDFVIDTNLKFSSTAPLSPEILLQSIAAKPHFAGPTSVDYLVAQNDVIENSTRRSFERYILPVCKHSPHVDQREEILRPVGEFFGSLKCNQRNKLRNTLQLAAEAQKIFSVIGKQSLKSNI